MEIEMPSHIDTKDKVSVVVITYNRFAYLERLLSFYEKYSFPFPIIVLDSSTDNDISVGLSQLLNNKRVTHKKYPEDLFLGKKIAQGLTEVKTVYCAICADDDFLIPQGVENCVAFLEGASDYSIAQGFFISHTVRRYSRKQKDFFWGPLYERQTSIIPDMPEDRLRFGWNGFNAVTWYSVFRTPLLRLIWTEAGNNTTNYYLCENLQFILSLIYSKVKVLPTFYCSREMNTYYWQDKPRYKEMYVKMYSRENCEPVIDCWAGHLSRLRSMDYAKARKIVNENFEPYLSRMLGKTSAGIRPLRKSFINKCVHHCVYRLNKLFCWFRIKKYFAMDFERVVQAVLAADVDQDLLRKTRQSWIAQDDSRAASSSGISA